MQHKIIIFGGQGRTGREVAELAAKHGHHVTIFARHNNHLFPATLGIHYVIGDARNKPDIARALTDFDVVINITAPGLFDKKNYDISPVATNNILDVMMKKGIKRYMSQSGAWATSDLNDASIFMQLGFKIFWPLREIYKFKKIEDTIVKNSTAEWTIFRAGLLTNRKLKPVKLYENGYKCKFWEIPSISRKSVAQAYLDNIDNQDLFKKFPVIIN
jgi:hypothetical protein